MYLTTECVIYDKPKKDDDASGNPPMGGGGMGDMGY